MIKKIIQSISTNCSFSIEELKKYKYILDWDSISCNKQIQWTDELIEEFSDYLNFSWDGLAMNPSLPITRDFLAKFRNLIEYASSG
ncbi:hypothetical protein E5358_12875 [Palleniella muris]|uniref:Uncharacterized protein n=1 Tax=Palleniella muris TaxID=3038145 RepID=A0AC61QMM9_9BACT|nr:hypothetical protein [Palleniella muris]TGX80541.1 hypothetical protein E5358_12875 [Palleniella muris]